MKWIKKKIKTRLQDDPDFQMCNRTKHDGYAKLIV